MNKKTLGIIFIILALLLFGYQLGLEIKTYYQYEREIMYNWDLADRSSTLEAKSIYLKQFVTRLENAELSEYNAILYRTPDNNVQNNIDALKTLVYRLNEIKDLDPESFAYQTAIQQITSQEQGEAMQMLSIIKGGWLLGNGYYLIWDWIAVLFVLLYLTLGTLGCVLIY